VSNSTKSKRNDSGEPAMRSDLVKTLETGQSRFELCQQAFKAIRKLHKTGSSIQDTTNHVFQMLFDEKRQEASNNTKNENAATLAA
jgi:hypothetical protein